MHFELICTAMKYVSNRFMVTRVAAKATRKLQRSYIRIEETFNDVLVRLIHLFPSSIEEQRLTQIRTSSQLQPASRI
jgi:hypothetical protein